MSGERYKPGYTIAIIALVLAAVVSWKLVSQRGVDRDDASLEAYIKDAQQHPRDSAAWERLGTRYLEMARPGLAEGAFRRSLAIDPDHFAAQRGIAWCDYYRGKLDEAIDELGQLLSRDDLTDRQRVDLLTASVYRPNLPLLYAEGGRFREALDLFEEARTIAADPQTELVVEERRSRILLRSGRVREALALAREVSRRSDVIDTQQDALTVTAIALSSLDSLELARSVQAQLVDETSDEKPALALVVRADLALAEGDSEAALTALREVQRRGMPQLAGLFNIEWRERVARANRMAGRLSEAAAVHEEMLRVFPGHALSRYELGRIYEDMGRTGEAERAYTAFLAAWAAADPGLAQLVDARRRLAALGR